MKMTLLNNFYAWASTILLSNGNNHLSYFTGANTNNGDIASTSRVIGNLFNILGEKINYIYINHAYGTFDENLNATSLGFFSNNSSQDGYNYSYFQIGSSNKEIDLGDIQLDSPIVEGVNYSLQAMHSEEGLFFTLTVTNANEAEIQIGEIGLYKSLYQDKGEKCLLGRCVLETPINLPTNQSIVFEIFLSI
jgi:hypothetical protein